ARIEADRLLAARLQEEDRETFIVEERAKFLYDTIAAQRRFLAQQRAAAIRKTHQRPRPQPDDDSDDEHRKCLRIVTFDSTLDSEIMETKSFVSKLHKVSSPDEDYLVDLFHLYDLGMKQYSEITPEGIELILWGDLKIMMESLTEKNDQGTTGENSLQSPHTIGHTIVVRVWGVSLLDGIFCQRYTCKSCGNGAHHGYNCPPKVLIISNSRDTCNNHILDELHNLCPQFLYPDMFSGEATESKENSSGSTTTHSDISLSKYDSFIFDLSNDPFTPTDRSDLYHEEFADELAHIISLPEYDCFYFKSEPDSGELTSIVDSGIREKVLSTANVNLPFEEDQSPPFAYVV
ncbi:hypothetical protein Tco_0209403, partial [Tanacetum coccineum]